MPVVLARVWDQRVGANRLNKSAITNAASGRDNGISGESQWLAAPAARRTQMPPSAHFRTQPEHRVCRAPNPGGHFRLLSSKEVIVDKYVRVG